MAAKSLSLMGYTVAAACLLSSSLDKWNHFASSSSSSPSIFPFVLDVTRQDQVDQCAKMLEEKFPEGIRFPSFGSFIFCSYFFCRFPS